MMESCLSGDGKTLMLLNIRSGDDNADETLLSLRFGKKVSQCDTIHAAAVHAATHAAAIHAAAVLAGATEHAIATAIDAATAADAPTTISTRVIPTTVGTTAAGFGTWRFVCCTRLDR